jgi:hypothetical protein
VSRASFNALIERQLIIAEQADPHHCSRCGRDLGRWYYGFPLPLCAGCNDIGKWGCCPVCLRICRQDPPGSGALVPHGPTKKPCPGIGQQFTAEQITGAYEARAAAEASAAAAAREEDR